jgi:hypothetical protein
VDASPDPEVFLTRVDHAGTDLAVWVSEQTGIPEPVHPVRVQSLRHPHVPLVTPAASTDDHGQLPASPARAEHDQGLPPALGADRLVLGGMSGRITGGGPPAPSAIKVLAVDDDDSCDT